MTTARQRDLEWVEEHLKTNSKLAPPDMATVIVNAFGKWCSDQYGSASVLSADLRGDLHHFIAITMLAREGQVNTGAKLSRVETGAPSAEAEKAEEVRKKRKVAPKPKPSKVTLTDKHTNKGKK